MKKRILSGLLAAVLCFSLMPTTFAAQEDFVIHSGEEYGYTNGERVLVRYNGPGGRVVIPDGVTKISREAFSKYETLSSLIRENCLEITSVTIPDSVTEIGFAAFSGCAKLTSVNIPDTVTTIGAGCFSECTSLKSISLPNSITTIEDAVFNGCSSLTDIRIPGSVTTIGSGAFDGTPWLKAQGEFAVVNGILLRYQGEGGDVVIPNYVSSINPDAMLGYGMDDYDDFHPGEKRSIQSVVIPDGVTSIPYGTFCWLDECADFTIPSSVTHIGVDAFWGTPWLENQKDDFVVVNGILIAYQSSSTETVIPQLKIPDHITRIGDGAFKNGKIIPNYDPVNRPGVSGLQRIQSIIIPDSVIEIGASAFEGCSATTSVTIGKKVSIIGDRAFYGCQSLHDINLPMGLTSIGNEAFDGCHELSSIDFPDSLTSIGDRTFMASGLSHVTIPSNLTNVGETPFAYCANLTQVVIQNGLKALSGGMFAGCPGLTSVKIPPSVISMGPSVFTFEIRCSDPPEALTIYGCEGSCAHTYAKENHIPFVVDPAYPSQLSPVAYSSVQSVLVNDAPITFYCYALRDIYGNDINYVKLRDVAQVLNGTCAQFEVVWDGAINLYTGTPYTSNGSEMIENFSGDQPYTISSSVIKVNGAITDLSAITLTDIYGGSYTYFKLRDLGKALNFLVDWDPQKGIVIEAK